jgi:hypothetical protein
VALTGDTLYGYSVYDDPVSGYIIQPNSDYTILAMTQSSNVLSLEFAEKIPGVFEGSFINIFGSSYSFLNYIDITVGGCYINFQVPSRPNSGDVGNSFPFTFTFAS